MDINNEYGTFELQKKCVELLKVFHSFCIDNGIKYSIAYGTLLGAVRHKGFIPWDDDIDILVDRENYSLILEKIYQSPLKIERITEKTLWTDRLTLLGSDYKGPGVPTIDIFVLDHSPNNRFACKLKLFLVYALQGMIKYHLSMKKGSVLMKSLALITFVMGRPFSHKRKYEWYQKVSSWGNQKSTKYSQCYNTLFTYISTKFPSTCLDVLQEVSFENITVMSMRDYDGFLKAQYGDYMTPPPTSERVPAHS